MSYYEEMVSEFLHSERTRFVSPGFGLDLGGVGPQGRGRNWWIDVLAVDFKDEAIYLCEATFAKQPTYMFKRLRAWATVWPEICENLFRITHVPSAWKVKPWVFAPEDLEQKIRNGVEAIPNRPFEWEWTAFEAIVPWKRPDPATLAAQERRAVTANRDERGGVAGEMFYIDENGNKADAALHAEMLDNPEADEKWRKLSKLGAITRGLSQEDADNIYGED